MRWWWLSFCDADLPKGSQFLGAVLIKASDIADAASKAWLMGINPGGEVQGMPAPSTFVPLQGWEGRLLSRADCEEFDRVHAKH